MEYEAFNTSGGLGTLCETLAGRVSLEYSSDVGQVLHQVEGSRAMYTLRGDEIHVRAKIVSTRLQPNPAYADDVEMAWTQPVGSPGLRPLQAPLAEPGQLTAGGV